MTRYLRAVTACVLVAAALPLLAAEADRKRPPVVGVDGDHRWFVENNAFTTHVDERVRGAEVNGHVPSDDGAEARKQGVCNHESASNRGERERVCGSGCRRFPPRGTKVYAGKVTKLQQSDGPSPYDYGP